jgi:hypothetical protein
VPSIDRWDRSRTRTVRAASVTAPVTEWTGSVAASIRVSVWAVAVRTVTAAGLCSLRTDLGWAVDTKLG